MFHSKLSIDHLGEERGWPCRYQFQVESCNGENPMLRSRARTIGGFFAGLVFLTLLTACGPKNPDLRPEDSKLIDGISLLMKDLVANHPDIKNWDQNAVEIQIHKKLPVGIATPAGWKLTWPSATSHELPYVYVPWMLTGTYPNHFAAENASYTAGSPVPSSVVQDLTKQQLGDDPYFAAIVDVRYSNKDKKWIIFTSVPYLPVTDNAYGWATVVNGRWKVIDFGTALDGCGKVPAEVQSEFGFGCPNN